MFYSLSSEVCVPRSPSVEFHWSLVSPSCITLLKNTNSPSLGSDQLPIVPRLKLGPTAHILGSMLGFESGLSLHGSCACCHHCCKFTRATSQELGKLFLCGYPPPLPLINFQPLLPQWFLSPGCERVNIGVVSRDKHSAISHSNNLVSSGLLC